MCIGCIKLEGLSWLYTTIGYKIIVFPMAFFPIPFGWLWVVVKIGKKTPYLESTKFMVYKLEFLYQLVNPLHQYTIGCIN